METSIENLNKTCPLSLHFLKLLQFLYTTSIAIRDGENEARTTSFLCEPLDMVLYQQVETMVSVMSPMLTVSS